MPTTAVMAPPLGYHVRCRLKDDRVIAPTPAHRRILSRVVLEKTREHRLLAHNAVDTHLHLELAENKACCMELARRIEGSLHHRLDLEVGFAKARPKPIEDYAHLNNCFDYIQRQQPHHGLAWDPLREASNLLDLLEMRLIGRHSRQAQRQRLPRIGTPQLLRYLGLERLRPADGPPEVVVPAALVATGLNDLSRRTPEQQAARRAILELVDGKLPLTRLAEQLGVNRRTLQRARDLPLDQSLVNAIRRVLGLRQAKLAARQAREEPGTV